MLLRHLGRPRRSRLVTSASFVTTNTTRLITIVRHAVPARYSARGAQSLPLRTATVLHCQTERNCRFALTRNVATVSRFLPPDLRAARRHVGARWRFPAAASRRRRRSSSRSCSTAIPSRSTGPLSRACACVSWASVRSGSPRPNAHPPPPHPPTRSFKLEPGWCVCVFPVTPRVQNRYGTLHGGCVATLVDVVDRGLAHRGAPIPG